MMAQDARLGVSVSVADRLAEMNARHRRERLKTYSAIEELLLGAGLLALLAVVLFVWAA